jgi:hypothetical protein
MIPFSRGKKSERKKRIFFGKGTEAYAKISAITYTSYSVPQRSE